jgi:hypothetical protein
MHFCLLIFKQLLNTIGTKRAASTRSKDVNKKARSTLRGAPPPPTPTAVAAAPEAVVPVAEMKTAPQPPLKKQKSEASANVFARVKKEPAMKRSKTELSLDAAPNAKLKK